MIFFILTTVAIKTSAQKQIEHDVLFKFNSSRIESAELKRLDSLLEKYRYGIEKITLYNRTDTIGSIQYNLKLGDDRGAALKKYLTTNGLQNEIIKSIVYGTNNPLASNHLSEGRAKNRSTRLSILLREDFSTGVDFIYKYLGPKPVTFEISNNQEVYLRTKKGTIVKIPPYSFVNSSGKPVVGKVDVAITECYDYSSMLLSNLTTESDSNGFLETGGMFNISASKNNKPLKLKDGQQLTVKIPADKLVDNMQVFYARHDSSGMQWNQLTDSNRNLSIEVKGNPLDYDFTLLYRDRLNSEQSDSLQTLKRELTTSGRSYVLASLIGKLLQQNEQDKLNKVIEKLEIQEMRFILNVDKVLTQTNGIYLFKSETMRSLNLNDVQFDGIDFKEADYIFYTVDNKPYEDNVMKDFDIYRLKLNNYVLNISQLGWINCDRFLNYPKTDLIASADKFEQPVFRLILMEVRGIIPGSDDTKLGTDSKIFKKIPKGLNAILIGYAMKDGSPYIATRKILIGENSIEKVELQKVTMNEFKSLLTSLN